MNCYKFSDWDKACFGAPPAAATVYTTNNNLPLVLPIYSWKHRHENKWWGGDVDESSVRPYPAPHLPLSASPTHPRSRHQVHSTMMLCLLKEGVWFQPQLNVGLHMARPRPKDEQYNPWQSTEKYIQMPVLWVVGRRSPSYEPGSSISSSDGNERLAGRSNCWINYSSAQWGSGLIYCCAKLKKTPIHSLR